MSTPNFKSMKPRKKIPYGWVPLKVCGDCRRQIVMVKRLADNRYIPIYLRSWDGNPWYDSRVHKKHLLKMWHRGRAKAAAEAAEMKGPDAQEGSGGVEGDSEGPEVPER